MLLTQSCSWRYLLLDGAETLFSHYYEVKDSIPGELFDDFTSDGESIESTHITVGYEILLFLSFCCFVLSYKLQLLD